MIVPEGKIAAGKLAQTLAYGARTDDLLIYRDVLQRTAARVPSPSAASSNGWVIDCERSRTRRGGGS